MHHIGLHGVDHLFIVEIIGNAIAFAAGLGAVFLVITHGDELHLVAHADGHRMHGMNGSSSYNDSAKLTHGKNPPQKVWFASSTIVEHPRGKSSPAHCEFLRFFREKRF